ncbi:hypothetical protein Tco_0778265 [Tanacetum coccineum]
MGSHTLQQLKIYSFDELKELFETTMKNVNNFVPRETEDRGRASELASRSSQATIIDYAEVRSSKRAVEAKLDHEGSKRKKTNKASGSVQEQPEEEEKELSQEDLQQMMMVVPVEEVYRYMHDPLKWRLYDTCGVYHVSTERGIDIFMLVEKEYTLSKGVLTLMLVNMLLVEQHSEMANELLRKIFIPKANTNHENKVLEAIHSAQWLKIEKLVYMKIGIKSQDLVMSDSEDSTVTYTEVSSPFEDFPQPSPDYVSGPKYLPLPEFVPEPVYPEFMPPEDEDEEDPEEDPTDYPADRGDDEDDDDESSDDDEDDDDDDVKEDEDEEEEHPALADSSSPLPQIPSPPLPVSSPVHVSPPSLSASPTYPLGYRADMIWLRAETPSTSHPLPSSTLPSGTPPLLPIPLPTPLPPLILPSTVCRAGVSEVTLPPRKRLFIALGQRYEVGESSSVPTSRPTRGFRADYGFVATLDDEIRRDPERDVGYGIIDTWDEMLDIDKIYGRLDDAQDDRSLMSGQLNMLYRDRRAHARAALVMEREARLSQFERQQGPAKGPAQPDAPEEAGSSS